MILLYISFSLSSYYYTIIFSNIETFDLFLNLLKMIFNIHLVKIIES